MPVSSYGAFYATEKLAPRAVPLRINSLLGEICGLVQRPTLLGNVISGIVYIDRIKKDVF